MVFSAIYFLVSGIIVTAVLAFITVSYERSKRQFLKDTFGDLRKVLLAGYNPDVQALKHILKILALFLIFAALAGPKFGTRFINIRKTGVDVIIAIDISRSMLAEDIRPNRLGKARSELAALVDRLKGNRLGIVAFSGKAFLQCPLTLDTGAVRSILGMLEPDLIPVPGTAIAEAISLAVSSFNTEERRHKALILLTDGEDHEGDMDSAVARAKKDGVRIFTIGFGSTSGDLIPERDNVGTTTGYKKDKSGAVVSTKLNEEPLQKMALETSALYFRATDGELESFRIAEAIDAMEKKDLRSKKYERYEHKFYLFALTAFLLLVIDWLI